MLTFTVLNGKREVLRF